MILLISFWILSVKKFLLFLSIVIKPNLLIRNFDTFSNHAAYIGEFSKDKMFYLESRGISKKNAIKLLMEGLLLGDGDRENVIVKEFMDNLKEAYNG